jgi:ribonuclease Z
VKVTFLGTSGAFPTAHRNGTAHVVWVQGETLLLDCGESTQRQLRRSGARLSVQRIFLSHLHLDHTLGLPGYVGTMNLLQRSEPLRIYMPRGTRAQVEHLLAPVGRVGFPVSLEELEDGAVVKADGFRVIAARVEHQGPALGFRIEEDERPGRVDVEKAKRLGVPPGPLVGQLLRDGQITVDGRTIRVDEIAGPPRPGRSLVYSGDTRPCRTLASLAKKADLLIHESTFTTEFADEAVARGHSTSAEAAQVARDSGVGRLALTHISQRHQESDELKKMVREGRAVFNEAFLPDDLDEVEIPLAS